MGKPVVKTDQQTFYRSFSSNDANYCVGDIYYIRHPDDKDKVQLLRYSSGFCQLNLKHRL